VQIEDDTITIGLELDGPEVVSGAFTVQGQLKSRDLPLLALQRAEILVTAQDGHRFELVGRTRYEGAHTYEWRVTGGDILLQHGNRMIWMAPGEPGLYGLELDVVYGRDGLAIDSIVFEVV